MVGGEVMVIGRCIFVGYLAAAVTAIALTDFVGATTAVLIAWIGGGCLAALLALAWHLVVPEDEPQQEPSAERWETAGQYLPDAQKEAA